MNFGRVEEWRIPALSSLRFVLDAGDYVFAQDVRSFHCWRVSAAADWVRVPLSAASPIRPLLDLRG